MKHSHGHTLLLTFACITLCAVAAGYVYMNHMIGVSAARAATARQALASAIASKNSEQSLIQAYQATAADRGKLIGFFIPADRVVSFIESIEALGPAAGSTVVLSSISADQMQGAVPGAIGKAHAAVDVRGSWPSVMKTLMLAEALPYQSSIDRISLDSSVDGSGATAKREWHASFAVDASLLVGTSTSQ